MKRARIGAAVTIFGAMLIASGCATRGQLERGLQDQRAALDAERAERLALEQRVTGEVQRVAGNVEQLRMDLASMETDFGAKFAQIEEGLQLAVPVHFAFDASEVRPDAHEVLDRFVALVQRHYPTATITVEGFTDPAGAPAYNRRLAQARADAVRGELTRRGLADSQVRAIGYGAERLVVPNAAGSQFGAELNRRVVFVIETPSGSVLGTPTASR